MYGQDIRKIQRSYNFCDKYSALGALPLLLALFLFTRLELYSYIFIFGFLMLPFTVLSALAAWYNHKLPPEYRANLELDLRGRLHHPYHSLALMLVLNCLLFLSPFLDAVWARNVFMAVTVLYVLMSVFGVCCYFFGKKRAKKAHHKK